MIFAKTCLLLGRTKDTLKLKKAIIKRNWLVVCKNRRIKGDDIKNIDLVITFNYRYLLKKKIIEKLERPAINLHISYLPFNRGSHPNFWSFIEKTPKGVSIHEIDTGLDSGPIIYQKKIFFSVDKKINISFFKTHRILIDEIQKLFLSKISSLLDGKYKSIKQKGNGTFHYKRD